MAATVIPALISLAELVLVWRATHDTRDVAADIPAVDSVLCLSTLI